MSADASGRSHIRGFAVAIVRALIIPAGRLRTEHLTAVVSAHRREFTRTNRKDTPDAGPYTGNSKKFCATTVDVRPPGFHTGDANTRDAAVLPFRQCGRRESMTKEVQ